MLDPKEPDPASRQRSFQVVILMKWLAVFHAGVPVR